MQTIAQPTDSVNLVSSALQAANTRLFALRHAAAPNGANDSARQENTWQNPIAIGETLLAQQRQRWRQAEKRVVQPHKRGSFFVVPKTDGQNKQEDSLIEPSVGAAFHRMYPDLLMGMLREERVAIGRIWLLCRHLDKDGRGWLNLTFVREQLTNKNSPLKIVGKRRLRQILADGAGGFWERDDAGRLWLFGVAKVAAMLGVERLVNRPIALPIADIVAGLAQTRAHCYAAFHSGRKVDTKTTFANPISRATLTKLCGVNERTQRRYDVLAGVTTRPCIAIGAVYNKDAHAETVWQRGNGTFKLTDYRGLYGQAGTTYSAWQLPNQYQGCHDRLPKGRQRKLNRQLNLLNKNQNDLVTQRAQGNGLANQQDTVEQVQFARRFFANGGRAVQTASTDRVYWLEQTTGNLGVWMTID